VHEFNDQTILLLITSTRQAQAEKTELTEVEGRTLTLQI